MKFKSIILIIFTLLSFSVTSYSQKLVKVKKSEFRLDENPEALKTAWKHIRKGNSQFRRNKKGAFAEALVNYLEADKYNSGNAALNYDIGVCYLKTANKREAFKYLDNAYKVDENIASDLLYWRGFARQQNYDFKKAIKDYEVYMASLEPKKLQKVKMKVDKRIEECKNGIELMKNPVRCFIDNLGSAVNTAAPEYSPIFFFKDSMLYFTSRREDTKGGDKNPLNQLYFEDVYSAIAKNGVWGNTQHLGKPINTKHNDAVVDISPDGKEVCVYRGHKGGGDLFNTRYSENKAKWSPVNKMRKIDKRKYHESSVSMSRDSMILYFISDRKGSIGGQDIWYSRRLADGSRWQKPQNLSSVVNTKYDEETVEISSDGKTLFFSSKGHNSMGGYDVFKTTLNDDGTWTEPVNIGYPINTPDNDVFFMLSNDEFIGYYASDRKDGFGDLDIYEVTFLGPEKPTNISEGDAGEMLAYFIQPVGEAEIEKPVNIKIIQLSMVKGTVTDFYSDKPLDATLELVDNATGKVVKVVKTYPATGAFSVPLPPGKDYALTAGANDYFFHSENFVISDTSIHEVIRKDIKLKPMGIGAKIVLNNVFFDSGKAFLRPESYTELNRLIDILHQYKRLVVEISGHTDSQGSAASNKRLSQRRAQAVVDYITSQGVNLAQIQAKGYGEDTPRADNSTKKGRQLNRRVEAKILSK